MDYEWNGTQITTETQEASSCKEARFKAYADAIAKKSEEKTKEATDNGK